MSNSPQTLPEGVSEAVSKTDTLTEISDRNKEQRISCFNLSDGPLSVSLNVYDGKDLKELVQSLLLVVRSQQGKIDRYEERFDDISKAMQAQENNIHSNGAKLASLHYQVDNIAQNLQGFVDADNETGPAEVEALTTAALEKSDVVLSGPQTRIPNPAARKRFQRAVKKVIMQIKMKNNFVGVLTSRAKKGYSIAERLKSAEDLFYEMNGKFDTMQKLINSQREEITSLRSRNEEDNNKTNQRFESTTAAINAVSDKVDGFSNLADDLKNMEATQTKMVEEMDEKVKAAGEKIQDGVDKLSKKFYDYQDSMAEITLTQGQAQCQLIQDTVSRCEALATEILKGQEEGGITSDQVYNLRREIGAFDSVSNSGRDMLTNMEMYMKVDPSNYSGLREPHSALTNILRAFEEKVSPLWGTVAQFDSNIAQSVNLIVTMQTGLSNQEEALRKMEGDIMGKASSEALAKIEADSILAAEEAAKIEGEMKKVSGEINDLSSNNADLSAKVHEMMDNMDNAVDEEKLQESVKKLLDIYMKQLEAKAAGNEELVEKLQKELEETSGNVENLFRTKANVDDVNKKVEKEELEETSATLQSLQQFVKQFEQEVEKLRIGQATDMDKLRRNLERKLMKGIVDKKGEKDPDEPSVSHHKLDLCLACNRPMGKAVNLNSSVSYYGPVDDPTGQLFGKRRSSVMPSMLLKLESERRRQSSIKGALLPRGRPAGLHSGGFNMPVKDGVWGEDLGGGIDLDKDGNNAVSEEIKVRRTLAKMNIDPDTDTILPGAGMSPKAKRHTSFSPKAVPKDWMKVTSSGVTVEADSNREKVVEALRRESRRQIQKKGIAGRSRGSSLHVTSPKASKSPKGDVGDGKGGLGIQGSGSTTKLPLV